LPWCARDARSGGRGAPCVASRELPASKHRLCSAFNVSVAEVARLVAAALEATSVCRRALVAAESGGGGAASLEGAG